MDNIILNIPISIYISFVFSVVIFYYLFSFKNKKAHLNIYTQLFLTFIFSGIFISFFNSANYSSDFILTYSFIVFFAFIFATYKKYKNNLDFYYFVLILFYSINSLFYYLIIEYPDTFLKISETPFLKYFLILLSALLIFFHKNKKAHNNIIFYSYLVIPIYYLFNFFFGNKLSSLFYIGILSLFFIIHIINAKKQVYDPLLNKIEMLEKEKKKNQADLPEHLRQKFQIMENNKAKLMDLAYTDKMTGVFNKDKITSQIKDLIKDPKTPLFSVLMFDIDNFKAINDNMGHLIGDECLIDMAKIAEDSIRKNDYLGRYGGDEFIVILPTLNSYDAKIIAERFRDNIAKKTKPSFTVSIGVSSFPEDGNTLNQLIETADQALYLSKKRGKNKVSHLKNY